MPGVAVVIVTKLQRGSGNGAGRLGVVKVEGMPPTAPDRPQRKVRPMHHRTRLTSTALLVCSLAALSSGAVAARSVEAPTQNGPYGYTDFYDVPHLGTETASGTGCGGDGSIGDTIPDGYWRGYVRSVEGGAVQFDLVCVYGDDVNPELISRWRDAHPGQPEPWVSDGFLVDNSADVRDVPLASTFFSHGTQWIDGAGCPFDQPAVPFDATRDAWLFITGGQAAWAVSSCAGPASAPPPPASGSGFQFPYADFWSVPQLGEEPVRGSGCGGDGSLGDTIPDGLWYGWIEAIGSSSLDLDVVCVYYGAEAQRLFDEFIAEHGEDYGAPPSFGADGFPVNNSTRTRAVPLAPSYELIDAQWVDNYGYQVCLPPQGDAVAGYPADSFPKPSWVFISGGQAQWSLTECPHD